MNKFIYIFIIFLFSSVNVYASKTDEIKKINEMFINGYIDENECAVLKYDVWKEFFPDSTYSCKNLIQKKNIKKKGKTLKEILNFETTYKEVGDVTLDSKKYTIFEKLKTTNRPKVSIDPREKRTSFIEEQMVS